MKELRLMKGNEAIAEAAIRYGVDAYYGYPITPQSEVMEYLMAEEPHKRTGMVVLQAESEVASINMVYGAAGTGRIAMTSSSSPGISLMSEGLSYIAGAELPCLVVNVQRGGPGLGTIQPGQADYFQATKGGGHGDYNLIVLAPSSVQEMADFVGLAIELSFKYRNPAMILSDGAIGQMMEKVELPPQKKRLTSEEIEKKYGTWASIGKNPNRKTNIITSLCLQPEDQEEHNQKLQAKYRKIEEEETRYEKIECDDAEYLLVAYGTSSRICQKVVKVGRERGLKIGLFRPITLWPYPSKAIFEMTSHIKGILSIEMNAGQMVQDVKLAVEGKVKVSHYGRYGGMIPSPDEVLDVLKKEFFIDKK